MTELVLERKSQQDKTPTAGGGDGPLLMFTPKLGEDYWAYRVLLSGKQAVVGFPKFMTIGIGFAVEDDSWNTNFPYTCSTEEIFQHIKDNKGDDAIGDDDVREAIRLIQAAVIEDGGPR